MAYPVFESKAEALNDVTVNTVTVAKPTGTVSGDLLIVALVTRRNALATHAAPDASWTQLSHIGAGTVLTKSTWWKLAGASEPSTYTFTWSGSSARVAIVAARFSGTNQTTPVVAATPNVGATETATTPSVTTAADESLVLRMMGKDRGTDVVTHPASHAQRWHLEGSGSGAGNYGSEFAQATAGASGTANFTLDIARDWIGNTLAIAPPSGGSSTITLVADAGAFSLAGQDAALPRTVRIAADAGSFGLSGQDVGLPRSIAVAADAGSITIAGQDAALPVSRVLTSDAGSFVLTGQDAELSVSGTEVISADAGAFSLSGQDASLSRTVTLSAGSGDFSLAGQVAGLSRSFLIAADSGTYAFTGQDASLLRAVLLAMGSGSFALTGQDAAIGVSSPSMPQSIRSLVLSVSNSNFVVGVQ